MSLEVVEDVDKLASVSAVVVDKEGKDVILIGEEALADAAWLSWHYIINQLSDEKEGSKCSFVQMFLNKLLQAFFI